MGLSSKKQTTTTNQTQNQQATTTPQNPQWVTDSITDWVARIGAFGDADPNAFVAPAAPLQQQAWNNTGQLNAWKGQMQSASDLGFKAANAGANLMGNPATYSAPELGGAAQTTAHGYSAPQLGPAQTATSGAGADNMARYMNPYLQDVIGTSLADFDHSAGQTRAAQAAQAARSGAFGGSRAAIREAQTEGELAQARGALDAELRAQGFNTAAGLGMADADRAAGTSQFNAGAGNQFALANGGMQESAQQFTAGARNAADQSNAGNRNQFALAQAGMDADAARYGVDAANEAARFNAGQKDIGLNRGIQGAASLADIASQYGAGTRSDLALVGDMGSQQRQIEQAYRMAPAAQLEMLGSMLGGTPFGLFNGQQVTGNSTTNGTNVTKSSPSLFDSLLSAAQVATRFIPK